MLKTNRINKTKYIAVLLIVAVCLSVLGCSQNITKDDDKITLLDPYEVREDTYNATGDVYNKTIGEFENNHQEIRIDRKTIRNEDYYGNINSYAAIERGLTDVFVISTASIDDFIRKGAICEEAEYIYPLSNINKTIIVYDKDKWAAKGFEKFPDNWEDIINVKDEKISIGEMSGSSVRKTYLTPFTYICCGDEWVNSLKDDQSEAPFVDDTFVTALEMTKELCDRTLSKDDYEISNRSIDRFLDGDVSAAVISINDMYELKEKMVKEDPKRYSQLGFSFIPANIERDRDKGENDMSGGASTNNKEDDINNKNVKYMTTTGISTVLVINSKVKEKPEKLAKCQEFCKFMGGQVFADNMAEMFGFECENKSDKTYNGDDSVWSDMINLINGKDEANDLIECTNLGLILEQSTTGSVDALLWQWIMDDYYTSEEIANYFQDFYGES